MQTPRDSAALRDVVTRFARLGLTAFGGPVAHIGYFRREFVERARWLDDAEFGEIVALCSVLPGPTSSQVGIALGLRRAGPLGALAAWFGFSLPSALAMTAFGLALGGGVSAPDGALASEGAAAWSGALAGFAGAAAAIVALAVFTLARSFAATRRRGAIAAAALAGAIGCARSGVPALQVLVIAGGAALGAALLGREGAPLPATAPSLRVSPRAGALAAIALAALLVASAFAPAGTGAGLAAIFFRAGSLVFGGGHVVLPFLESALGPSAAHPNALLPTKILLAGYGAAQTVPGPLFTFAAFAGAANRSAAHGLAGAAVATLAIFLPSFLLVAAAVPLWSRVRALPRASAVLAGANAAVVGLLGAVLADPIGPALVGSRVTATTAAFALVALTVPRAPVWAVAFGAAAAGAALAFVPFFAR